MLSGVVNPAVQAAQLAAVNHPAGIWAGPNADSLSTANRKDGTHFNDTDADLYAGLWRTAACLRCAILITDLHAGLGGTDLRRCVLSASPNDGQAIAGSFTGGRMRSANDGLGENGIPRRSWPPEPTHKS
jgi:hypothetical protein